MNGGRQPGRQNGDGCGWRVARAAGVAGEDLFEDALFLIRSKNPANLGTSALGRAIAPAKAVRPRLLRKITITKDL